MANLLLALALLLATLVIVVMWLLPRPVRYELTAEILHDLVQGAWRAVFGPRRVQIVKDDRNQSRSSNVRLPLGTGVRRPQDRDRRKSWRQR